MPGLVRRCRCIVDNGSWTSTWFASKVLQQASLHLVTSSPRPLLRGAAAVPSHRVCFTRDYVTRSTKQNLKPSNKPETPKRSSHPGTSSSRPAAKLGSVRAGSAGPRSSRRGAPKSTPQSKIQTVPFHRTPIDALKLASLAAHGVRGRFSYYRLLLSQFMVKIVGTKYAPSTGLRLTSFSALLVPVWRVDLAVRGTTRISNERRNGYDENLFHVLAINNQVPGHAQAPLDRLAITSRSSEKGSQDEGWDTEPVPFSVEEHGGLTVTVRDRWSGDVVEETWPTSLTVIPFTHHPLNMLAKLAALPSTTESRHGVSVDTSKLKSVLFTTYPLYLPIYQAEYAVTSDQGGNDHITSVVFGGAKSMGGSHSTYSSWLPNRSWTPVHNGIAPRTKIVAMPFTKDMDTKVSTSIWKRFNDWLLSFERYAFKHPPPFQLVDPIYNWSEQVDKNPRAKGEWNEPMEVLEYVETRCEMDVKEALIREVKRVWVMGCAEHVKDTERGKNKLKADQKVRKTLTQMQEELDELKRRVRTLKLDWLEDVEQDLQRRASVGGGR